VSDDEKLYSLLCMSLGVIIYCFFASSITEIVLMKSFQATESISRKNYIDLIVDKYKLPKKSKDYLEMLIDSVYNSPLIDE